MLNKFRNFSGTLFAKVFLIIVAIPFIFWGMGDLFSGGNQNTIVKIDDKKISTQKFINYIKNYSDPNQKLDSKAIEKLLADFIGEELLRREVKKFNISISDNSLAAIIRNQKMFKKENKFSRNEYEKFLIKNRISAANFEKRVLMQEEKRQLLDLIGLGVVPSVFMVNKNYDKINQKRKVNVIDLNIVFKQSKKFEEKQIQSFFEKNKETYSTIYKSIKFVELNPINLIGKDEFNDLFFSKIDKIDDLIVEGESLNNIANKFDLKSINETSFDYSGKDKSLKLISNFPKKLVKNVFNIDDSEKVVLLENNDKYFVIELIKTENIQNNFDDVHVKKDILLKLENIEKRKFISDLISKIENNNFGKNDFDQISKNKNIPIKEVLIKNINDDNFLKAELVEQIYLYPEKKVIIATDIGFTENFLVYIDSVKNVTIDKNSEDYNKYLNLTKFDMKSDLFNTYDLYLKNEYKIKINQNTLKNIKNYF